MRNDFAVFILSHGRSDRIVTLKTLEKVGYTGKIYIIIDNEDKTADEYRKLYGDKVIEFDKLAISKTFDTGDNFDERRTIVYARNACFDIARNLGIKYFLQLDDDYTSFSYRFPKGEELLQRQIPRNIDTIFEQMIVFMEKSKALTVAFAQGGDMAGGRSVAVIPKRCLEKL